MWSSRPLTRWTRWFGVLILLWIFLGMPMGGLAWAAPESQLIQYQKALPGYHYRFPKDHGAHRAYKTEWWYYTGHFTTEEGHPYGYEITFFRVGSGLRKLPTASPWALSEVYVAHFALTDVQGKRFHHWEKITRPGVGLSGADAGQGRVWVEGWALTPSKTIPHGFRLQAQSEDYQTRLDLHLRPAKGPIIHGQNGVSQKAACVGCASHYYSLTRLQTTGTLVIDGVSKKIKGGQSWMDHEFGSNQLSKSQVGWDWFSLQLNNGWEAMLYVMRRADGTWDPYSSGTLIPPQGPPIHLRRKDFLIRPSGTTWTSPHSGGRYPLGWQVSLPRFGWELNVTPRLQDQELTTRLGQGTTYWEGACTVSGQIKGKPVSGLGYTELTGYAQRFRSKI